MSLYCGTKAAVEIMTQIWAKNSPMTACGVNAISVGSIEIRSTTRPTSTLTRRKEHMGTIRRALPQRGFGQSGDIAAIATFLSSEVAGFGTGSVYGADGGFGA